jgi:hypothetical protein
MSVSVVLADDQALIRVGLEGREDEHANTGELRVGSDETRRLQSVEDRHADSCAPSASWRRVIRSSRRP